MLELFFTLLFLYLTCSALGSLLVLQNQSMIIDALSHSVLLGIVLGFFIVNDLNSPFLIIGASIFGVLTVFCVDYLLKSPKINHDTATGLVFPFFFSLAVILISTFLRNVHIDSDMVLMGEIIFTPLTRLTIFGLNLSVALFKVILLCSSIYFIYFFNYWRLNIVLADKTHAKLVGVPVQLIQMATMIIVSLTTVIAFDIVGSFTVICLYVAPNLSALPFAKNLKHLLLLGGLFAIINSTLSIYIAHQFDLTISGTCAFISLITFILATFYKKLSHYHLQYVKTKY